MFLLHSIYNDNSTTPISVVLFNFLRVILDSWIVYSMLKKERNLEKQIKSQENLGAPLHSQVYMAYDSSDANAQKKGRQESNTIILPSTAVKTMSYRLTFRLGMWLACDVMTFVAIWIHVDSTETVVKKCLSFVVISELLLFGVIFPLLLRYYTTIFEKKNPLVTELASDLNSNSTTTTLPPQESQVQHTVKSITNNSGLQLQGKEEYDVDHDVDDEVGEEYSNSGRRHRSSSQSDDEKVDLMLQEEKD
jgi:hypothetical protein